LDFNVVQFRWGGDAPKQRRDRTWPEHAGRYLGDRKIRGNEEDGRHRRARLAAVGRGRHAGDPLGAGAGPGRARSVAIGRLIKLGGLAVKAGIDELPANALYACFLRIAKDAQDARPVAAWEREGARHFQREVHSRVVAVAKFSDKIAPEVAASLRALAGQMQSRKEFTLFVLISMWSGCDGARMLPRNGGTTDGNLDSNAF